MKSPNGGLSLGKQADVSSKDVSSKIRPLFVKQNTLFRDSEMKQ